MVTLLKVRDLETGEVVETITVNGSEDKVDRVMSGLLINMNTDRYVVDEMPVEPPTLDGGTR